VINSATKAPKLIHIFLRIVKLNMFVLLACEFQ
jgi:hypothetical protein